MEWLSTPFLLSTVETMMKEKLYAFLTSSCLLVTVSSFTLVLEAKKVMEVAKDAGLTDFYKEVEESGLLEHANKAIKDKGTMAPFTVFAPTNEAMKGLRSSSDQKEVRDIIKNHVVPLNQYNTVEDIPTDGVPSVGGELILRKDTTLFLEGSSLKATISGKPLLADNGVVYPLSGILRFKDS